MILTWSDLTAPLAMLAPVIVPALVLEIADRRRERARTRSPHPSRSAR